MNRSRRWREVPVLDERRLEFLIVSIPSPKRGRPVYQTEGDVTWLTDEWDAWEFPVQPILTSSDSHRLGHGFVGPCLVRDLLEERIRLLRSSRTPRHTPDYAPALHGSEVTGWLDAPLSVGGAN